MRQGVNDFRNDGINDVVHDKKVGGEQEYRCNHNARSGPDLRPGRPGDAAHLGLYFVDVRPCPLRPAHRVCHVHVNSPDQ